jgi:nitrate/nitrite transporter NarK
LTDREGTAIATMVAAGNVAALVVPAVTGALRDATGDYTGGFLLLAVLNLVALGSVGLLAVPSGAPTETSG